MPAIDLCGQHYGKLLVLERAQSKPIGTKGKQRICWKCLCECGKTKIVATLELRNGRVKSCGCLRGVSSKGRLWRGHGEIGLTVWNNYKYGAKDRKIPFDITIQQGWELFLKQGRKCALTGLDIKFASSGSKFRKTEQTASLDRIDSKKGYEITNIQWVHKDVNKMKMDLSIDKFLYYCKLVYKQKEKNDLD